MYQMSTLVLTLHAMKRTQQRGISETSIETIYTFGTPHYAGSGCIAYFVDRQAIQDARRNGYEISGLINTACIVAENRVVVTVEHARKKPRNWSTCNGGRS